MHVAAKRSHVVAALCSTIVGKPSCASNAPLREKPSVVTAKSAIGSVTNVSRPSDTMSAVGLNAAIFSAHVDSAAM